MGAALGRYEVERGLGPAGTGPPRLPFRFSRISVRPLPPSWQQGTPFSFRSLPSSPSGFSPPLPAGDERLSPTVPYFFSSARIAL
uniref:Uncharacterized protein n=1 Tax=Leptospirillum ferrodiazotrophum TaxID=412449 RepID=C6HYJ3_9BACT|nr:MAG: hypothetical protein UBAL3_94240069 [Leptospirillum ferrodiazotrophum]